MSSIKFSDLGWGSMNNIQDGNSGQSGDRRRTPTSTTMRMAVETAFSKDTLNNITEFNGVVVSYRPVTYASYKNRSAFLDQYAKDKNPSEDPERAREYPYYAYKVLIPEMEPRKDPKSDRDPVLITYSDVYSDVENPEDATVPIPGGTLVAIKYEDFENLFNPRIVRIIGGPILFEGLDSESLANFFGSGTIGVLGNRGDAVEYPVEPARTYDSSFFNPSAYRSNLASKVNSLDKSVQENFAQAIKEFIETYFNEGLDIQITYGYRSLAKQSELGRSTKGPVAKPGSSWHNYGAAIDVLIFVNGVVDENGASENYTVKARNIFQKYGLINDIKNDGGHFYPAKLGKAPTKAIRVGGGSVTLESLLV